MTARWHPLPASSPQGVSSDSGVIAWGVALSLAVLAACDAEGSGRAGTAEPRVGVRYVDAAASEGGNGSEQRPYRALPDALSDLLAATGPHVSAVAILAAGDYVLPSGALGSGVDLRIEGAGADRTRLLAAGDGAEWSGEGGLDLAGLELGGALRRTGGRTGLSGVEGSAEGGSVRVTEAAELTVRGGIWRRGEPIIATGVEAVSLLDVTLAEAAGTIAVSDAGDLMVTRLVARRPVGPALWVARSRAIIEEPRVEDATISPEPRTGTDPESPWRDATWDGDAIVFVDSSVEMREGDVLRSESRGLVVSGGDAVLSQVTLEGAGRALLVSEAGADVTATELVARVAPVLVFVSDAAVDLAQADLSEGANAALLTGADARVRVRGSYLADCPNGHLSLLGDGTEGVVVGTIIERAELAACVAVSAGARLEISDTTVMGCAGSALSALSAELEADGVQVRDVVPDPVFADVANGIDLVDASGVVSDCEVAQVAGTGIACLRCWGWISGNTVESPGAVGISVVDPNAGGDAVGLIGNRVVGALGAGIFVSSAEVLMTENVIESTRVDPETSAGDGIAFTGPGEVIVLRNTVIGSGANGVLFLGGAVGEVSDNDLVDSRQWGVREYCVDGPNDVTVGANRFDSNGAGEALLCE